MSFERVRDDCGLCIAIQHEETVYQDDKVTCLHNLHHNGLLWIPNKHVSQAEFFDDLHLKYYMEELMQQFGEELFDRCCVLYNFGTALTQPHAHAHQLPNFVYHKDMRFVSRSVHSL